MTEGKESVDDDTSLEYSLETFEKRSPESHNTLESQIKSQAPGDF